MSYQLVPTSGFKRRFERFNRTHPELRERIAQLFEALEDDPFQPQLRLHALSGRQTGLRSVSVNYQYHMLLRLDLAESQIFLVDIGSHDEVYR